MSLGDESGMRAQDLALRAALPPKARPWVGSFNSMMAIPIRGVLLAQALAPLVGTVLETHPRASLWFSLGEARGEEVFAYKPRGGGESLEAAVASLWGAWSARYGLRGEAPRCDGGLDALVCATVARLFHQDRGALWRPPGARADAVGRGPLYVTAPAGGARR
jgi:predicted nuclease with RNAse H fold